MDISQYMSSQPWVERLGWTLIHFLWQGALIAAIYAFARRSRMPQFRYLLACAALAAMSAAPIVTFSLTGTSESAAANPYVGTIPQSSAVADSAPALPATLSPATFPWHNDAMAWLVLVWFAGAMIFSMRLTGGWIVAERMRSKLTHPAPAQWQQTLDELRLRIRISRPVQLIVSAIVQVPIVVGGLRPVVLIPAGALLGLPRDHIEALLAHELAHIRRHDYFVNILQSAIEALLFYHPAVWWISNQIRNERELCCDDVAVAISGDAINYARALADLESQRPAHFNPALAASGGSLRERIGRLLGQPTRGRRQLPGPGSVITGILIITAVCGLFAQTPVRRSFETISIKPNDLGGGEVHEHNSPGRLNARMSAKHLIRDAFAVKDFQIIGGPAWLGNNNYDFLATTATPIEMNDEVLEPYLQSLLADRFQLKYHRETKEFPIYFLLAAKTGPKLTKHTGTTGFDMNQNGGKDKVTMSSTKLTMAGLASWLAREMDRPVIDHTGIGGDFDVNLEWSPQQISETSGPSIFTALQEQLGLRLEAGRGPVEMIVVDSIEKPSEN
jgi:uncharacterized protein (TIGR03435 family)